MAIPDGITYIKKNCDEVFTNDFKNEKELKDFIVRNIRNICKDWFNDEVISFETEKQVIPQLLFQPRRTRVDLYIHGKKDNYIIELKRPVTKCDNRYGIGQVLNYGRELEYLKAKLCIVTTKFDQDTAETISYYGLPIRYMFTSKTQMLEYIDVKVN
jgi:hypothetical protein